MVRFRGLGFKGISLLRILLVVTVYVGLTQIRFSNDDELNYVDKNVVQNLLDKLSPVAIQTTVETIVNMGNRSCPHSGNIINQELYAASNNKVVRDWLVEQLANMGLAVEPDNDVHNVIATKVGSLGDTANVYILGAHFDSVALGQGATDNACGVAMVIETARIVSRASFQHTIRFCLWELEEGALAGSRTYVANLTSEERSRIKLYINYDPEGFNADECFGLSNNIHILVNYNNIASREKELLKQNNLDYNLGFQPPTESCMYPTGIHDCSSDHFSFWSYSIPALNLHEWSSGGVTFRDYQCNSSSDTLDLISYNYACSCAKLGFSVIAVLAGAR